MWQLNDPQPVKLIVGILAANSKCLNAAIDMVSDKFGNIDLSSEVWPFDKTAYYKDELGTQILRQFVCIEKLIDPGELAKIKIQTNKFEQKLAKSLSLQLPRPVNLDRELSSLRNLSWLHPRIFHIVFISVKKCMLKSP